MFVVFFFDRLGDLPKMKEGLYRVEQLHNLPNTSQRTKDTRGFLRQSPEGDILAIYAQPCVLRL
jgi:hypothetical protein